MKSVYILLIAMMSTAVAHAGAEGHDSPQSSPHYSNDLPVAVALTLGNRYHHFDLIHSRRNYRQGRVSFDLIIQHRSGFAKISIGQGGHYYGETYYDDYPLDNHYCDEYCSFQYQHYEDNRFATYDPYYGCDYHVGLIVNRYPNYVYRPYYGYGSLYYHPGYRWYKRYKHYSPSYGNGYYVHRRPFKYYNYGNNGHRYNSHKYGNRGYRNSGRNYGNKGRSYKSQGHSNHGNRNRGHRGSGNYQNNGHSNRGSGNYQRDRGGQNTHRQHGQRDSYRQGTKRDQGRQRGSREELNRKRGQEKFKRPGGSTERSRRRSS